MNRKQQKREGRQLKRQLVAAIHELVKQRAARDGVSYDKATTALFEEEPELFAKYRQASLKG